MSAQLPHLTPQQRILLDHFRHTRGAILPMSRLVNALYGDRHDGGPEYPEPVVRVQLHHLRSVLRPLGVRILTLGVTSGARGYMIDPDCLDRLEEVLKEMAVVEVQLARERQL